MWIAILLGVLLISGSVHAQTNPFAPGLDELKPPPGQPICSDWYRNEMLPKFGCPPDLIQKICTGQLPKVQSGPYCGDLIGHSSNMGMTCKTQLGQCPLREPALLNVACYCTDIAKRQYKGSVIQP